MSVTWAQVLAVVGFMSSMTVVIPWLVKLFVKPEIDKVLRSIDRMFIRHLSAHHVTGRAPKMMYRKEYDDTDK